MRTPSLLTGLELKDPHETQAELEHPLLDDTRNLAIECIPELWERFNDTEEGSAEEIKAARDIARMYLILNAGKAALDGLDMAMWSERFTEASGELYGITDQKKARNLIFESLIITGNDKRPPSEDISRSRGEYIAALQHAGVDVSGELAELEAVSQQYESVGQNVITNVREGLDSLYGEVFAEATDGLKTDSGVSKELSVGSEELKSRFERGIGKLAERDSRWKSCEVVIEQNSRLRVVGNKIYIGSNLKPRTSIDEILRPFAHEVLVHAQLNILGITGRNLDGEEGLAVIFEQAFGLDNPPQRIKDRYMDISIALGQQGSEGRVGRQKLMQVVRARNEFRGVQGMPIQSESAMANHVNRIYRGTLGTDGSFGIFTKDLVYFEGYATQGEYLEARFSERKPDEVLLDILTNPPKPGSPLSLI